MLHTGELRQRGWPKMNLPNLKQLGQITGIAIMVEVIVFIIIFCAFCSASSAEEIEDETLIRCAIGEASNQGTTGMQAVINATMNRGTIKGVYGCNSKHIDNEPAWVWDNARLALKNAKIRDITNGADHWENIKQFGKPKWADKMQIVFKHKDHVFYKSPSRHN